MKPRRFGYENKILGKPNGMTDNECGSLPIYTNGSYCISCWETESLAERIRLLITGKVFLTVIGGDTQPPVSLVAVNPRQSLALSATDGNAPLMGGK